LVNGYCALSNRVVEILRELLESHDVAISLGVNLKRINSVKYAIA